MELRPLPVSHPDPTDLEITLSTLESFRRQHGADSANLVIDGYNFDTAYQEAVKEAGFRFLCIDDTALLPHYHANIILNQILQAHDLTYRCDSSCTLLMGTRFALLRPEFKAWRNWERNIPKIARKVLVTLGAGDPENVTLEVMKALEHVGIPNLEVVVVAGPANPHLRELSRAASRSSLRIRLIPAANDMPALMAWADFAVTGGGSTCWELSFMRLPSLVLVLADNQIATAAAMQN
jgi:UDP-2,4-diacetamido-2,4,6-trideoxy-beta-L-altropyranose hydrolase